MVHMWSHMWSHKRAISGLFSEFVWARIWAFYKRFGQYAVWAQNGELYVAPEYGSECGVKCGFKIWCCGCMLSLIFGRGPERGHLGRFKWEFI